MKGQTAFDEGLVIMANPLLFYTKRTLLALVCRDNGRTIHAPDRTAAEFWIVKVLVLRFGG
jgi:hypothetical protein